jgi:hypothetical protein
LTKRKNGELIPPSLDVSARWLSFPIATFTVVMSPLLKVSAKGVGDFPIKIIIAFAHALLLPKD